MERYNFWDTYTTAGSLKKVTKEDIDPAKGDTFPYFRYIMSLDSIRKRLDALSKYEFRIVKTHYRINNIPEINDLRFNGALALIIYSPDDYLKYNKISDYYQDYARCRARRYDNELSSHEMWVKNWEGIYEATILVRPEPTAYDLREAIYFAQQEVGSFRCTNLAGIIEMFKSRNVLDFSAGWGDRLAAAVAKKVKYTGVDPNTAVHVGYEEFIRDFGEGLDIKMIQSGFENPAIDDQLKERGPYDLVFTSPPYFNLEIYSDEKTQSADDDTDLDEWYDKFLMVAINKSISLLKDGGYLIININDIKNGPHFVARMVGDITKDKRVKYLGVLSYAEQKPDGPLPKSGQPMWVWRRISY